MQHKGIEWPECTTEYVLSEVESWVLLRFSDFSFVLIWLSDTLRGSCWQEQWYPSLPPQKRKGFGHCTAEWQLHAVSIAWKVILCVELGRWWSTLTARSETSERRSSNQGITETLRRKVDVLSLSVQPEWGKRRGNATPELGETVLQTIWDISYFFK